MGTQMPRFSSYSSDHTNNFSRVPHCFLRRCSRLFIHNCILFFINKNKTSASKHQDIEEWLATGLPDDTQTSEDECDLDEERKNGIAEYRHVDLD